MSPKRSNSGQKAPNNLYTAILALAFFVVVATSALVAYRCYMDYETIFQLP